MKGSKVMSILVVATLVFSALMVTTVVADRRIVTTAGSGGHAEWILSNDGFGSQAENLSCGEIITLYITNNSLTKNTNYRVRVWNGTHFNNLTTVGSRTSDSYGDLAISFRVPGWKDLGNSTSYKNPVTENGTNNWSKDGTAAAGQWNVSLWTNDYSTQVFSPSNLNATINIGNHYYVRYKYNGNWIDHLVYNSTYSSGNGLEIHVFNWTGTQLAEAKGDTTKYKFNATIYRADGTTTHQDYGYISEGSTVNWKGIAIAVDETHISTADREKTFWVNVSNSNDNSLTSNVSLPVLLDVTLPTPPDDVEWDDDFTVAGKVLDGNGVGEKDYAVRVYYPINGTDANYSYDEVTTPSTVTTGTYSLPFETGSGKGYGAGTWYVGTYSTPGTRVDKSNEPPYIDGFIPYHSFEVGTKDDATVVVNNADDITKGFTQTINVSVKNESWMDNYEFRSMKLHITGLKGYNKTDGVEYGRNDVVAVTAIKKGNSDSLQYYEFDWMFNETGTATIWASWPKNLTDYDYNDSGYSNTYGDHSTSLIANVTGSATFSVVSPGTMTVIVNNPPEAVEVTDPTSAGFTAGWQNATSQYTNISVYGSTEASHKNATISVSGCGLDFTVNESASSHANLIEKGYEDNVNGAWYNLSIIPKTAGTLTITITNDTTTVTKDYTVTGLTGTVSTSVGDNLEITVGTTETIRLSGVTEYAEVTVTFFDEDWVSQGRLNYSSEAGEFSFKPDSDDIDKIGYIVVVAGVDVWDQFMYDIIEVVPVDDFTVEVTTPDEGNQTLTVGIEQEVIISLTDSEGDAVVDDSPAVTAKLIDDDHDEDDPLQTFTFTSIGDDEWSADIQPYWEGQLVITGYNASTGIKHIGTKTVDVEHATVTYTPGSTTAGIGLTNLTIAVSVVDPNGNPVPDGTTLYLHEEDTSGTLSYDTTVDLTDGEGEFDITTVGDLKTYINGTFQSGLPSTGNRTTGKFDIDFPTFTISPSTIYIGQSNIVSIWAKDTNGEAIEGINLTLWGNTITQPEPVETNSDGKVVFSLSPDSSGYANITIARNVRYVDGQLNWTNAVITDSYVTIDALNTFTISVSKSPAYQGETLTVTVKSGTSPVEGVAVTFGELTGNTDSNGEVDFEVPDPGVESATYIITAEKDGYITKDKSITVIKVYTLSATATSSAEKSTVTVDVILIGKGPAVGATVTFNGETDTTDADGQVTFTAPTVDKDKEYTVSVEYDGKTTTTTVTVKAGTPGFELLTLIAAIGVAFILLRRRRH